MQTATLLSPACLVRMIAALRAYAEEGTAAKGLKKGNPLSEDNLFTPESQLTLGSSLSSVVSLSISPRQLSAEMVPFRRRSCHTKTFCLWWFFTPIRPSSPEQHSSTPYHVHCSGPPDRTLVKCRPDDSTCPTSTVAWSVTTTALWARLRSKAFFDVMSLKDARVLPTGWFP